MRKWKRYNKHAKPIVIRLREIRERRRIPRKILEHAMGYHCMTLGRWERGETLPSCQALHDWCQYLGVRLEVAEMDNTYELQVTALCPADHKQKDSYRFVIEASRMLKIEDIKTFFAAYESEPVYQEDLTRICAAKLPGIVRVISEGSHSDVKTVCTVLGKTTKRRRR